MHAVTGVSNIRFDIASDVSSRGKINANAAAEIIVSATGSNEGIEKTKKLAIEFNKGQSSLTGLCASLLFYEFIKKWQLDNDTKLYTPESLVLEPTIFLDLLVSYGVKIIEL